MPLLSIVVPVYKCAECLPELYRRVSAACTPISPDFELILVEDCGGDQSWDVIRELAAADARVRGLRFTRNFGQHYGITAGLDVCDGDWVVVMDCDLQDQPEEIPKLYAKAQEGYDVVLARRGRRQDSWLKRQTSAAFYAVFKWLTDMQYDGEVGNFRIMSRNVVESFRTMRERLRFFGGLMTWIGYPTASVNVQHAARFAGTTTYSWRKLLHLATGTILAYSDKPLRLAIRLGFLISAMSGVWGTYFLYRALHHRIPVSGWASLIISLYFLSGVIIAVLGVVGLYVGEMFAEVKRRPLYLVRDRTF